MKLLKLILFGLLLASTATAQVYVRTNTAQTVWGVKTFKDAPVGNGAGLTNVTAASALATRGQPQHINLKNLWRWRNNIISSNEPFVIMSYSDQGDFPKGFQDYFVHLLGVEGSRQILGITPGGIKADRSAGVTNMAVPPTLFISTGDASYDVMTSPGQNITYNRYDTAGIQTNVAANKAQVLYAVQPMSGTFAIRTNANNGAWGVLLSVNANASTTNLTYTNISLPTGNYSLMVSNVSGTNWFVSSGLWATNLKRFQPVSLRVNSGASWTSIANTNTLKTLVQAYQPNLIISVDYGDGLTNVNWFTNLMTAYLSGAPNADHIFLGVWNSDSDGNYAEDYNPVFQRYATQYNAGFFDSAYWLKDTNVIAQWITNALADDTIHVSDRGANILNMALFDEAVGMDWIAEAMYIADVNDSQFEGLLGKTLSMAAKEGLEGRVDPSFDGLMQITNTDGMLLIQDQTLAGNDIRFSSIGGTNYIANVALGPLFKMWNQGNRLAIDSGGNVAGSGFPYFGFSHPFELWGTNSDFAGDLTIVNNGTLGRVLITNSTSGTAWIVNNVEGTVKGTSNGVLKITIDLKTGNVTNVGIGVVQGGFQASGGYFGSVLDSGGQWSITSGLGTFNAGIATLRSNKIAPVAFTFPATTVNWTNPLNCNIEVYIDNTGVTGTQLNKNGAQIAVLPLFYSFGLQSGEYFSETYTIGTPTGKFSPR